MHYDTKVVWKQGTAYQILNDRFKRMILALTLSMFGYCRCIVFIQILGLKILRAFCQISSDSYILAVAPQILTQGATVAPHFQGLALSEYGSSFSKKKKKTLRFWISHLLPALW